MIPSAAIVAVPAAMQAAAAAQATPAAPAPTPTPTQPLQASVARPAQVGHHAPELPGMGGAVAALLLVLGLIIGLSWLLKRMPGAGLRAADGLRVVASIPLGARERAAVVQVGSEQLLLGIGAGGVRTLHVLAEPLPDPAAARASAPALPDFRQLLAQRLRKDR